MKYSNRVIVNQYPFNLSVKVFNEKININIDRNITVGIICTKNFFDKNLILFEMFQIKSFLYRINPHIKKNKGILNNAKNSRIPKILTLEKYTTCQHTTNIIEKPRSASI